jgi:hypothetical protein
VTGHAGDGDHMHLTDFVDEGKRSRYHHGMPRRGELSQRTAGGNERWHAMTKRFAPRLRTFRNAFKPTEVLKAAANHHAKRL